MADRLAIKCNWKRANIYMITNTVYYTLVITDQRPDRVGLAVQWHFAAGESSLFGSVQHFGRSNGKSLPILPSRRLQKRPWRHNKVHSSHRHGPSQRDPQPVQSNRSRIRLQQPCTHQSGISLFFLFKSKDDCLAYCVLLEWLSLTIQRKMYYIVSPLITIFVLTSWMIRRQSLSLAEGKSWSVLVKLVSSRLNWIVHLITS